MTTWFHSCFCTTLTVKVLFMKHTGDPLLFCSPGQVLLAIVYNRLLSGLCSTLHTPRSLSAHIAFCQLLLFFFCHFLFTLLFCTKDLLCSDESQVAFLKAIRISCTKIVLKGLNPLSGIHLNSSKICYWDSKSFASIWIV